MSVAPTNSNVMQTVKEFLSTFLQPTGIIIQQGQQNRAPLPEYSDFAIITPILQSRIETTADGWADVLFTGSISGSVLTVNSIAYGKIVIGSTLWGENLRGAPIIDQKLSGLPGQLDTYHISLTQNDITVQQFASGQTNVTQPYEVVVQVDLYGPQAANNAAAVCGLAHDIYAVDQFSNICLTNGFGEIAPLYAEDPRQLPFIDDEQQYESRWSVDFHVQANIVVSVPQQFAMALRIGLISVDAVYQP